MDLNSQHFVLIRELREALRVQNWESIESLVEKATLETLLDPALLSAARALNAREVVVLLASIGSENSPQPLPYRRLLAAYRLMQQQIEIEEALDLCETSHHLRDYYEALLRQIRSSTSQKINIPTALLKEEDLWFGIQLLCDTHCPTHIFPLLEAWQTIDLGDKPWLLCSRLIIERAETARGNFEREIWGNALNQAIDMLPLSQASLKPILQAVLLEKLWLPNSENCKSLELAQTLVASNPSIENKLLHLRAIIKNQMLVEAISSAEEILLEIINEEIKYKPSKEDVIQRESKYQIKDFDTTAAELTLTTVNEALRSEGLKPFLISGSLLGCMRDGRIMPHDKDLDMGLIGWESQFNLTKIILNLGCFDINLKRLIGKNLFLITAKDQRTDIAIDFFFFHEKIDHFLHGIDYQYGFTQNFKFSKFNLIETKFLGQSFFIPDNWAVMLSENYGEWEKPEPVYVVTVESPAIIDKGSVKHQLVAHLELLKTINGGLKPQRAQRIIEASEKFETQLISNKIIEASRKWIENHQLLSSMN